MSIFHYSQTNHRNVYCLDSLFMMLGRWYGT